jgi:hypothetical protein
MLVQTLLTIVGLGALPLGQAISGKSYTGWDWQVHHTFSFPSLCSDCSQL